MCMPSFWPFGHGRQPMSKLRLRVLVADEDPKVREPLKGFLDQRGCEAAFASDGTAALLCMVESREPRSNSRALDVVIADADLPGTSGIDLLMQAKFNHWDVRLVLTSAFLDRELAAELTNLGAAAVLSKPISILELDRTLSRIAQDVAGR